MIHTTPLERRLVQRLEEKRLLEQTIRDLSGQPYREERGVRRYDPRHSEHWYLGVSGFQWMYILGAALPNFFVWENWWWGFMALVFWWSLGWLTWCDSHGSLS